MTIHLPRVTGHIRIMLEKPGKSVKPLPGFKVGYEKPAWMREESRGLRGDEMEDVGYSEGQARD